LINCGLQADDRQQSTAHLNELQILFFFDAVNKEDNQINYLEERPIGSLFFFFKEIDGNDK
jgi:hypothetical protein